MDIQSSAKLGTFLRGLSSLNLTGYISSKDISAPARIAIKLAGNTNRKAAKFGLRGIS
jgi:hypothetical protein